MFTLLDVHFFDASASRLVDQIKSLVRHNTHAYICTTSLHGLFEAQRNSAFQQALNAADANVCDGMPLVWLGKLLGRPHVTRIYGPSLMLRVCNMAEQNRMKIFLFGTTPATLGKLSFQLKKQFPKLIIAGVHAPPFAPFTKEELTRMYRLVNASGAQIVFVGLSTPKQEQWMFHAKRHLRSNVSIGVGAAFDFISGTKKQAPVWMSNLGLEWLFRFTQEPKRLGKRYAVIWLRVLQSAVRVVVRKIRVFLFA